MSLDTINIPAKPDDGTGESPASRDAKANAAIAAINAMPLVDPAASKLIIDADDTASFQRVLAAGRGIAGKKGAIYTLNELTPTGNAVINLAGCQIRRAVGAKYAINVNSFHGELDGGDFVGQDLWTSTTVASGASIGSNTITVASVTGLAVGMYLVHSSSFESFVEPNQIADIAGNVLTLVKPLRGNVVTGDKVLADFPLGKISGGAAVQGRIRNIYVRNCLFGFETGDRTAVSGNIFSQLNTINFSEVMGAGLIFADGAAGENVSNAILTMGTTRQITYSGNGSQVRFVYPWVLTKRVWRWGAEPSIRLIVNGTQLSTSQYTIDTATGEVVANVAPGAGTNNVVIQNYEMGAFGIIAFGPTVFSSSSLERITGGLAIYATVGQWIEDAELGFFSNFQTDTCGYAGAIVRNSDNIHYRSSDFMFAPFPVIFDGATNCSLTGGYKTSLTPDNAEFVVTPGKTEITVRPNCSDINIDLGGWTSDTRTSDIAVAALQADRTATTLQVARQIGYDAVNPGRIYQKKIRQHLPFKFADYATIVSTYGYTYLYPQGAAVQGGDLFILYLSAGGTSGIGWNWIAVYDWASGAYKYCFSAGSVVGEGGGAALTSGGSRYFIGRDTATSVSYFDITSVTTMARLTAARTEEVERTLQVSVKGNEAITSDRTSTIATVVRRNRYKRWDISTTPWTLKSVIMFPFNEVGQYGDSTETSTVARPLPKTQGIAFGDGWYAHGMGGYYAKAATVYPYNLWGIRLFSDAQTKIADGLVNPSSAIAILEAAGVVCTRLESEGAFLGEDGKLYSINVTQTYGDAGSATGGIVIMEEMSDAPAALDFASAAMVHPHPDRALYSAQFPNSNGKFINPYTATEIATMEQMCDFMLSADISQTSWYTSTNTAFTDISGAAYATGQRLTIYNPNNSTFLVEVAQAGGSLVKRYRITGTAGSRTQTPLAQTRVITSGASAALNAYDLVVVVNKTTGSATTLSLPASPATDQRHTIKDGKGDAATNNITITPAAGTIDGAANLVIATNYGVVRLIYNGTQWNVL